MKRKKDAHILGLIIIMFMVSQVYVAGQALDWLSSEERAWLADHPKIRYAFDPDFAPFEFYNDQGPQGMSVDILKLVESKLNIEFEMVHLGSWGQVLQGLRDKSVDMISATPTGKRREQMHFSNPYISMPTGIIIREGDTSIKNFSDLEGRRISTVKGWSWNEVLAKNHPDYTLVTYDTIEESLNAIVYGDVDATILDFGTASYQIGNSKITSLKVLAKYELTQDVAYAVREDYEILVDILNKTVPLLQEEIDQVQDKWIRLDVEAINNNDFLIRVVTISLLVLSLLAIWSISLKFQVNKKTKALKEELERSQKMQVEIAQINHKLKQSEREIRAILDTVPSSIFVKDPAGRYIVVNASAAKGFGTTVDDMVGKTSNDFKDKIEAGGLAAIKETESQIFKGIIQRDMYTLEINDGKGNNYIHDVIKMPILDDKGKPEFVLTVGTDITETYEKNKALQAAYSELKKARSQLLEQDRWAAIGAFVAGIAHDINTPLGSSITISSHLQKLIDDSKNDFESGALKRNQLVELYEDASESLNMLDAHLHQAAELIQNFKTVSVRQINEVVEHFDLGDYLKKIALSMKYECKIKGVQIQVDCDEQIIMNGTPGLISQVFTNLISNSLNHGFEGREKGQISIKLKNSVNQVHIRYEDDGNGMTENVLNEVFKPFFTTKKEVGGSGLGMHIVQTIVVENLGGRIEINSQYGHGVQFDIFLPNQTT